MGILEDLRAGVIPPGVGLLMGWEEFDGATALWTHHYHLVIDGAVEIVEFTTPRQPGDENRPAGRWYLDAPATDEQDYREWVGAQIRAGLTPPDVEVCGRQDAQRLLVVLPGDRHVTKLEVYP